MPEWRFDSSQVLHILLANKFPGYGTDKPEQFGNYKGSLESSRSLLGINEHCERSATNKKTKM